MCLVVISIEPLPAAGNGPEQSGERPVVRLIATGGTISNRATGRLLAGELTALVPSLDRFVTAETEQFSNKASSDLTLDDWLRLARRINQLFEGRPDLAGVVVTSGTDTLEETAYFLHLTVRDTRPVVVVGSMRPPSAPGYDGAANLRQAFRVAAEPASRDRGVLVVLNAEVNSAREVTKTDAQRLDSFGARGYGVLGVVDPDRVVYYRHSDRRHTAHSEFDVSTVTSLPRVDIVPSYQDAPGDLILAALDAGTVGLVVAAAGAGSTSQAQRAAIEQAVARGVPVVMTTRTGGRAGRAAGGRDPARSLVRRLWSSSAHHGRGPVPGKGPRALDARADEDTGHTRDPADVRAVLESGFGPRATDRLVTPRVPHVASLIASWEAHRMD